MVTLSPLVPLYFVNAEGITILQPEDVATVDVGEKAFGLCCLPPSWTLPYFVISDTLLASFTALPSERRIPLISQWIPNIREAARLVGLDEDERIIIRSSGCREGLDERGKFHSVEGTLDSLVNTIENCLSKLSCDDELSSHKIPLILQKLASPLSAKGHLSNERRCSKESRDWLGEFESSRTGNGESFKINLRNWRRRVNVAKAVKHVLSCNLKVQVSEVLKGPVTWVQDKGVRVHFEWVWDGKAIYLVQADHEAQHRGVDPTLVKNFKIVDSKAFLPRCLVPINELLSSKYPKVKNVCTYLKLGLPTTQLYVLEDLPVLQALESGSVLPELKDDLLYLLQAPLVIRTDIQGVSTAKRQFLPRTEVLNLEAAIRWLQSTLQDLRTQGLTEHPAFILHNFIPATSSAFAYAAPEQRIVQIEALWGLPEGLYYNAHDKFIVDTQKRRLTDIKPTDVDDFEISEKVNFKQFFVVPEETGQWLTRTLQAPYDWRPSISNTKWIKEIAFESRRIAEEVGDSLSIMWFVGVPAVVCEKPIFPWHHENYDPKRTSRLPTERTKTPYDETRVIRTYADIDKLAKEAEDGSSRVCRIRIQPIEEELLRDKNTLKRIGEIARKISAVIMLEGGVLSHAYYQLLETKAIVEVLYPFAEFENKQEFNKLVRDKVPANIERGGEVVRKARLVGEPLLRALREKLTEEAFEVLDAPDQDSIVGELADLKEVSDAILKFLNADHDELLLRQKEKREKAGGFEDGVVLLGTTNPLPTNNDEADAPLFETGSELKKRLDHKVERWSDKREHSAASELILKLEIPFVLDNWSSGTSETVVDRDSGVILQAKLTGKRLKSSMEIELSIFQKKQLKLF